MATQLFSQAQVFIDAEFTTRSRTAQGTTTPKQRALYGCLDRGSASSARCRSSPSHAAVTGRHRPTARLRRLRRVTATRRIPQRRTRRVREEGGSTSSTGHDSVTVAVLGLLLHGDAVGAGGEVR